MAIKKTKFDWVFVHVKYTLRDILLELSHVDVYYITVEALVMTEDPLP